MSSVCDGLPLSQDAQSLGQMAYPQYARGKNGSLGDQRGDMTAVHLRRYGRFVVPSSAGAQVRPGAVFASPGELDEFQWLNCRGQGKSGRRCVRLSADDGDQSCALLQAMGRAERAPDEWVVTCDFGRYVCAVYESAAMKRERDERAAARMDVERTHYPLFDLPTESGC